MSPAAGQLDLRACEEDLHRMTGSAARDAVTCSTVGLKLLAHCQALRAALQKLVDTQGRPGDFMMVVKYDARPVLEAAGDAAGAAPEETRASDLQITPVDGTPLPQADANRTGRYWALCQHLIAMKERLTPEQCAVLGAALDEYADLLRWAGGGR